MGGRMRGCARHADCGNRAGPEGNPEGPDGGEVSGQGVVVEHLSGHVAHRADPRTPPAGRGHEGGVRSAERREGGHGRHPLRRHVGGARGGVALHDRVRDALRQAEVPRKERGRARGASYYGPGPARVGVPGAVPEEGGVDGYRHPGAPVREGRAAVAPTAVGVARARLHARLAPLVHLDNAAEDEGGGVDAKVGIGEEREA